MPFVIRRVATLRVRLVHCHFKKTITDTSITYDKRLTEVLQPASMRLPSWFQPFLCVFCVKMLAPSAFADGFVGEGELYTLAFHKLLEVSVKLAAILHGDD
jgi:hypothetical protein